MLLVAASLLIGILVGLALGGNLDTLSRAHFRWWPLALLGLVLQLVPVAARVGFGRWLPVGFLIASYVVLLTFVVLNIRQPGFSLVALGFGLNLLVILLNGGMPVGDHALHVAYGPRYQATVRDLAEHGSAKHHLARPDDVLLPLTDVIGVPAPVGTVFAVGDVISMVGVAWVLAAATKGPAGRHRRRSRRSAGSSISAGLGASSPTAVRPEAPMMEQAPGASRRPELE